MCNTLYHIIFCPAPIGHENRVFAESSDAEEHPLQVGVAALQVGVAALQVGVSALQVGVAALQVGVSALQVGVAALQVGSPLRWRAEDTGDTCSVGTDW